MHSISRGRSARHQHLPKVLDHGLLVSAKLRHIAASRAISQARAVHPGRGRSPVPGDATSDIGVASRSSSSVLTPVLLLGLLLLS